MADTLRWIVCQRLMPKVEGGRIAAFEILGTNLLVKDMVPHGETEEKTFYDVMERSQAFHMMTFDQCIAEHFKHGLITEETAMAYASHRSVMGRAVGAIKSERGEKTTTIEGLEIDKGYGKDDLSA